MSSTSDTPERPEQGLPPRAKSGRRPPTIDLAAGETTAAGDAVPTPEDTTPAAADPAPAAETARDEAAASSSPKGGTTDAPAGPAAPVGCARETSGGSGAIKLIAAAVIGGAVAIGGASALVTRGVIKSPEVTATSEALQTLGQRVATLENQAASNPAAAGDAALKDVEARLAKLESAVSSGTPGADLGALQSELKTDIADLGKQVEAAAKAAEAAQTGLSQLGARVDEIDKKIAANDLSGVRDAVGRLNADADAKAAALAKLQTEIDGVAQSVERTVGSESSAATSFALSSLERAAAEGRGFAAELSLIAATVANPALIDPLKAVATDPPQSAEAIAAQWPDTEKAILAAAAPPVGDGLLDKLEASAKSLIVVRPSGPVDGSDAEAVASRINADMKNGALAAALKEWRSLPEASQKASQAWGDDLARRVALDDGVAALKQAVLGVLAERTGAAAARASAPQPAAN
ncbi:COG4223 family protein [Segnochrobactrum spirostomi]|uniref:Phage tail protein n=1 Tax=Segnochrobactrum spirostomi TaxID=2608987 RepID=A0A6A7Y313_9HYPH|nr:hypothetical protein [Segnochrobactrum spirostomi]MQT13500.1 hypothetical protein [Segnochrobactrum spirostomi]